MNRPNIVLAALVFVIVALAVNAYFEREKIADLQSQIQAFNVRLDSESSTVKAALDDKMKTVEAALAQVQSLENRQLDTIAEFDERMEAMETELTPQVIAAMLVSEDVAYQFASIVADQLWAKRHADLVMHPKLIASAAAEVYEKYGQNLRGEPGASASAEEIARVLASEPGFADLVVQLRDHYNGN